MCSLPNAIHVRTYKYHIPNQGFHYQKKVETQHLRVFVERLEQYERKKGI